MHALIFSKNLPETFLILTRIQQDYSHACTYTGLHVKCPFFLPGFNKT